MAALAEAGLGTDKTAQISGEVDKGWHPKSETILASSTQSNDPDTVKG